VILRLHRRLVDAVRTDLRRPHAFAAERVGFIFARPPPRERSHVQVAFDYEPVPDSDYVNDDCVGARFNGAALRAALQRSLDLGAAAFHVHLHDHRGFPSFSVTDERSMTEFVPPFANLVPTSTHGALVISADSIVGAYWNVRAAHFCRLEIGVVGFPLLTPWRERNG